MQLCLMYAPKKRLVAERWPATNIVFDENFANKLGSLEQKPIFVYCAAGGRSAKAANILRQKGYSVFELDGGIRAWKDAGLPIQ